MKRVLALLALSAVITALMPSVSHAAPAPVRRLQRAAIGQTQTSAACMKAATMVHAFTLTVEWNKRVFKRTESALVTVTVTRPAPYDPLGLGIPIDSPVSVPVEGANVWTAVYTGQYPFPYGYGQTDAAGQVHFKIALKLLKKPGPYNVSHYANVITNPGGCPDIEEYGYTLESPGVTIVR